MTVRSCGSSQPADSLVLLTDPAGRRLQSSCVARLVLLVESLVVLMWAQGGYAQSVTYSMSGTLTSVPACVSTVFAVGDSWTIDLAIDDAAPVDDRGQPEALTDDAAPADDGDPPEALTDDATPADDGSPPETVTDDAPLDDGGGPTETYAATTFSWTVGAVSGDATGVTRVFVSDDHLAQDSITLQALSYSATFSPSSLGDTEIRGIQAGLVDPSASVFSSTALPEAVVRSQFARGFFQVFFQTKCEVFGDDTLTGSVASVVPAP